MNMLFGFAPLFVLLLSVSGIFGGLSVIFAILFDLCSILTFQVYLFHAASARIVFLQLNVLSSLWKLFRGEKISSFGGGDMLTMPAQRFFF